MVVVMKREMDLCSSSLFQFPESTSAMVIMVFSRSSVLSFFLRISRQKKAPVSLFMSGGKMLTFCLFYQFQEDLLTSRYGGKSFRVKALFIYNQLVYSLDLVYSVRRSAVSSSSKLCSAPLELCSPVWLVSQPRSRQLAGKICTHYLLKDLLRRRGSNTPRSEFLFLVFAWS
jgi:hypothetical protein